MNTIHHDINYEINESNANIKNLDKILETLKDDYISSNLMDREDIKTRIVYIQRLILFERSKLSNFRPKIFVSYSGDRGIPLFNEAIKTLKSETIHKKLPKIEVTSGMRLEGEPSVLNHILANMKQCNLFLGILTREHMIQNQDNSTESWYPGSWGFIELGMALSLNLRCIIMIESGIDKNLWFNIVGSWKQIIFENRDDATELCAEFKRKLNNYSVKLIREQFINSILDLNSDQIQDQDYEYTAYD